MRHFFDTNMLVYSRDRDAGPQRDLARSLIEDALDRDDFVISTQVLAEFYAVVVRRRMLGPAHALELVRFWSRHDTVSHTPELVVRGLELHQAHSLSIWDALILQAALDAGCDVLYTEDMQHGRRFGDLEIVNPFLASSTHEKRATYRAGRKRAS